MDNNRKQRERSSKFYTCALKDEEAKSDEIADFFGESYQMFRNYRTIRQAIGKDPDIDDSHKRLIIDQLIEMCDQTYLAKGMIYAIKERELMSPKQFEKRYDDRYKERNNSFMSDAKQRESLF